jgi:hypothetical protein
LSVGTTHITFVSSLKQQKKKALQHRCELKAKQSQNPMEREIVSSTPTGNWCPFFPKAVSF